jgi:hypothetical protein
MAARASMMPMATQKSPEMLDLERSIAQGQASMQNQQSALQQRLQQQQATQQLGMASPEAMQANLSQEMARQTGLMAHGTGTKEGAVTPAIQAQLDQQKAARSNVPAIQRVNPSVMAQLRTLYPGVDDNALAEMAVKHQNL